MGEQMDFISNTTPERKNGGKYFLSVETVGYVYRRVIGKALGEIQGDRVSHFNLFSF